MERRQWKPYSATDGEIFVDNRCSLCVNDRFDADSGEGKSCPIWMRLLIGEYDTNVYWDDVEKHGECEMFYPGDDAEQHGRERAALDIGRMPSIDATVPYHGPTQTFVNRDHAIAIARGGH